MNDQPASPDKPHILPVTTPDGHRSELISRFPDNPGRVAPAPGLLWLPAMGVTARKYESFSASLAARGVAVALLEWRGFGSSDRRAARGSDWSYRELLADIAAARTALTQHRPDIRWHVGGHSLGGQVAALALAHAPDDYAGYVIAGSGQPWWRTFPWHQQPLLLAAFALCRTLAAVCGYFPGDRTGFAGREARGVIRDWARSGQSGRYAPAAIAFDFEAALARIEQPVLALRFVRDTLVPRASLDHMLAKLPRATVVRDEIGDAEFARGHAGHFDWMKDPLPVVRRIAEWLEHPVEKSTLRQGRFGETAG